MKKNKKANIVLIVLLSTVVVVFLFALSFKNKSPIPPEAPVIVEKPIPEEPKEVIPTYHSRTLTSDEPLEELIKEIGYQNLPIVLRINRTNSGYLTKGSVVTIPDDFEANLSPFPKEMPLISDIPKLLIISQRVQAVGFYEYGKLIKWGPTSTGKKDTPTLNGVFGTNWKGKEVISSFDDEWILKWNFNIVNFAGIGIHEYTMPGYPASHSCVRLFGSDAEFLYNWADQWILASDGKTRLAYGTPVIIFGDYDYDGTPPWKLLPQDPTSTNVSYDELNKVLNEHIETIRQRQEERAQIEA